MIPTVMVVVDVLTIPIVMAIWILIGLILNLHVIIANTDNSVI